MSTVAELVPGQVVRLPVPGMHATYIAQTQHPIWPHLRLVIWRLSDGSLSLDALDPRQQVGEADPSSPAERQEELRRAMLGRR